MSRTLPIALAAIVLSSVSCMREPPPLNVPPPTSAFPKDDTTAAGKATGGSSVNPDDQAFQKVSERFLARYLELHPVDATQAGEHRHDARYPDWSEAGDSVEKQFIADTRAELGKVHLDALDVQNRVDAAILTNQLDYWEFSLTELRGRVVDPTLYTGLIGDGFDPLLTREFAPLDERMRNFRGRLQGVADVVAVAKKRLSHPARVHTETAIDQNKGLLALTSTGLAERLTGVSPDVRREVEAAAKSAHQALTEFQTFLEKELLPKSDGNFRLGRPRLEKKLRFVLDDDLDIDGLAKGARTLLAETRDQMVDTAKEIWPTLFDKTPIPPANSPAERRALVKKVLDKLADDAPTNATILKDATRLLDQATAFVREKDLVGTSSEPCRIIEMPEYRRGVAIAYCDSSGPLEKKQETFYAISPTPSTWPKKRSDSFYREYNQSMLADLTVHEAMPGHYLQAMHGNRFKSNVRAVFANGAFVEGWAVYAEWVMAQHGFGGPRVRLMRQKMALRLACNAILDHEIHAGTMDEKAALGLMMNDAFQEEGEAVAKWKRARLTSAQLSTYFYGFTEMMKLRNASDKKPGFVERQYHDRLLSFGSPSFRHLRPLMLGAQ
jgi:uncharacterized protein (DUF885 family)